MKFQEQLDEEQHHHLSFGFSFVVQPHTSNRRHRRAIGSKTSWNKRVSNLEKASQVSKVTGLPQSGFVKVFDAVSEFCSRQWFVWYLIYLLCNLSQCQVVCGDRWVNLSKWSSWKFEIWLGKKLPWNFRRLFFIVTIEFDAQTRLKTRWCWVIFCWSVERYMTVRKSKLGNSIKSDHNSVNSVKIPNLSFLL